MTLSVWVSRRVRRRRRRAMRQRGSMRDAVDVDSEDEAVVGGPPVRGMLDAASQLTYGDLSEDSQHDDDE